MFDTPEIQLNMRNMKKDKERVDSDYDKIVHKKRYMQGIYALTHL